MSATQNTHGRPDGWPEVLCVLDNGGSWGNIAVDPDDQPVAYIAAFLRDVGETPDAQAAWDADQWARVEWDAGRGCYYRPRYERADGSPTQYERIYAPGDLSYLPDAYLPRR